MSQIHMALKESADLAGGRSAAPPVHFSSLDRKLIEAGISSEIIVQAHAGKKSGQTGFLDYLIRKKPSMKSAFWKFSPNTLAYRFG